MPDTSMTAPASHTATEHAVPPALEAYLRAEVDEIRRIYLMRFPQHRIRFVILQGNGPVWGDPQIVEGTAAIEPAQVDGDCLGMFEDGSTAPDAPRVSIRIRVPRLPTEAEERMTDAPWQPSGRGLGRLYALSPMLYERLRYAHEVRQERRAQAHRWAALPFGGVTPLFAPLQQPPAADKSPAIVIAMHWLETGGAEKLAFDSIRWAREAGLRIIVVANVPSVQRMRGKLGEDVTFIRLDRYLPQKEWALYLENLIRAENVRILHIHHCIPAYAALAHLRLATPWLKVADSTHVAEYADGGFARVSAVWSNFIHLQHVISHQLRDLYARHAGAGQRVRLGRMLPTGPAAVPPPPNMTAKKTELSVTFIGRLYYQKRPLTVVLIMKALADWAKKAGVKIRFDMIGEGPFEGACHALLGRLGIRDLVTTHAAGADVPAILSRSDILLLPSSNEGLALVCYEAVEHGAIPISTDVGGQAEIIPEALLVPRDPSKALAATVDIVHKLWTDQTFLDAQVAGLHARYAAIAAEPKAEEVILGFYREALSGRGAL